MEVSYPIFDRVNSPTDLKSLSDSELSALCAELRQYLVDSVGKTGGHLASNLGVVELSVALHQVFDTPSDRLIWDVGHQCYVHKLLTERKDAFSTIRQAGGLSGFTKRSESVYDPFGAGHSSTSLSAALGFATADKLAGRDHYTVAIVGDGAFTGGLIHEALDNLEKDLHLIIVLNENEMSISPTRGSFAQHLAKIRQSPRYHKTKKATRRFIQKLPLIGNACFRAILAIKKALKNFLYNSNMFENMGLYYLGPVDGNDYTALRDMLREAEDSGQACLLHIRTVKGKGYAPAEELPNKYHGVLPGYAEAPYNYSAEMGRLLCERAESDRSICAITAAMAEGCGLTDFAERFPDRFFDVGIAEEHALVFAAGLAAAGQKPVFAVYSTFLQRGYDNLIHDIALQNLPVTICIDRASLAKSDGPTHHGIFDVAFLGQLPNVTLYAPASFDSLARALDASLRSNAPTCIRYPNATEQALNFLPQGSYPFRRSFERAEECDCIIVTYSQTVQDARRASDRLLGEGIVCGILLLEQLLPVSTPAAEIAKLLPEAGVPILFWEESIRAGGLSMLLCDALTRDPDGAERFCRCRRATLAIDDPFVVPNASETAQSAMGIDVETAMRTIRGLLGR